MRIARDTRHNQDIYVMEHVADIDGIPDGAPTLLGWPQFFNPEEHESECAIPDKLFRFCLCKDEPL